jgi:hypothetical protein
MISLKILFFEQAASIGDIQAEVSHARRSDGDTHAPRFLRRYRHNAGELLIDSDENKDPKKAALMHRTIPAFLYSSLSDDTRVFIRLSEVIARLKRVRRGFCDYAGKVNRQTVINRSYGP